MVVNGPIFSVQNQQSIRLNTQILSHLFQDERQWMENVRRVECTEAIIHKKHKLSLLRLSTLHCGFIYFFEVSYMIIYLDSH